MSVLRRLLAIVLVMPSSGCTEVLPAPTEPGLRPQANVHQFSSEAEAWATLTANPPIAHSWTYAFDNEPSTVGATTIVPVPFPAKITNEITVAWFFGGQSGSFDVPDTENWVGTNDTNVAVPHVQCDWHTPGGIEETTVHTVKWTVSLPVFGEKGIEPDPVVTTDEDDCWLMPNAGGGSGGSTTPGPGTYVCWIIVYKRWTWNESAGEWVQIDEWEEPLYCPRDEET